jgi:ABC-type uncharacterized transport system permease subunit
MPDRRAVFVVACLGAITCSAGMALYFVVLFLALAVPGIGGGALAQAIGLTGTAAVMLVLAAAIAIVLCVAARHPRVTRGL